MLYLPSNLTLILRANPLLALVILNIRRVYTEIPLLNLVQSEVFNV